MRNIILASTIFAFCHCSVSSQKPSSLDAGACSLDPTYRVWLQDVACCEASKEFSVNDPCRPGTITIACDDAGPCVK
jgi:hypothetical protein